MSHKKDRMKTSKLSSTVLDYYYKYGQNRDLEKYLRMKRRSGSKSSSDSSLKNIDSTNYNAERNTKSMDKLDFSDNKTKSKDGTLPQTSKSTENISGSSAERKNVKEPREQQPIKIEKKTQQHLSSKSKSKSYNFNLESSIEINLPPSTSMPTLATTHIADSVAKATRILQLESAQTQTEAFFAKQVPATANERTPPAVTIQNAAPKPLRDASKPVQENIQETSPASSVASAKVRLEWDSMADIGYNRIIDFKSQSNSNLTTYEKSALTKFFAKHGLNFDDNLVIIAPPDSKSPTSLQKREFTQSAIEMREAQQFRKDLPSVSPTTHKQLWERALKKYRDKYGKSKMDATSGVDTTQFMSMSTAPHHSTPLPIDLSNSGCNVESSVEYSNQSNQKPVERMPEKPIVMQTENWCQTTLINVEAVGVQVEQPRIEHASKSVQIGTGKNLILQFLYLIFNVMIFCEYLFRTS